MVVGVHGLVGGQAGAGDFVGAVGQHLVHVHVRLCARAGLPHHQRELAMELACQHIIGGLHNQSGLFFLDATQASIGLGGSLFHQSHGVDQRLRQGFATDFEVIAAALGLRAPVGIGGYFHIAHGVVFGTGGGHGFSFV